MVQIFCDFTTLEDDCHKRMFTTKNNKSPKQASQLQTFGCSPGFESEDAEEEDKKTIMCSRCLVLLHAELAEVLDYLQRKLKRNTEAEPQNKLHIFRSKNICPQYH